MNVVGMGRKGGGEPDVADIGCSDYLLKLCVCIGIS